MSSGSSHESTASCCRKSYFRRHLSAANFFLEYDHPVDFVQFQFGGKKAYLIWRCCWAIYHFCFLLINEFLNWEERGFGKWLIYLTNLSYVVITLTTILEFIGVIYVHKYDLDILHDIRRTNPTYWKVIWVMCNIGNCASIVVSVLYWGMLYRPEYPVTSVDIGLHIMNSVYVILNVSVAAFPVRLFHYYQPFIYGTLYVTFTFLYYKAGGTNPDGQPFVYYMLDWRKPESTSVFVVITLYGCIPLVQIFLFSVYLARVAIFKKAKTADEESI